MFATDKAAEPLNKNVFVFADGCKKTLTFAFVVMNDVNEQQQYHGDTLRGPCEAIIDIFIQRQET